METLEQDLHEYVQLLGHKTERRSHIGGARSLGVKQLAVGPETVEVFGVERAVEEVPALWHCYFLADGHLASREQLGSPEDMEMRSKFLDRKEELMADHASYLRQHPELRALLADFLQFLLLRKPDNVIHFAKEYFLPFSSR
ncbi:hypothetical protein NHX12_004323 [Muraenolepis orangiensis]|uniref:Ciliogenesis-associated TTC17-interacting protein n=1 Tax=Muraenolepis orangiensis TaxID=630683 RepID=A0A9Q0IEI5_9TELE|nr:hypothetical protein NHX12_004323 [Muraenolepis orangiensis]